MYTLRADAGARQAWARAPAVARRQLMTMPPSTGTSPPPLPSLTETPPPSPGVPVSQTVSDGELAAASNRPAPLPGSLYRSTV